MSDEIKRLVDHFNSFIATSNTNKTFSAQEFVAYMEPVFAQCGYREKPAPDKQLKILIVRDDAAGDFILFSPFLRESFFRQSAQGEDFVPEVSPPAVPRQNRSLFLS